jgi:maleylpyruvate isomerase
MLRAGQDGRMSARFARLVEVRASTSALLAGLDAERWTDADVRAASVLPGWTRGHVLTHIARNADGIAATLAGALRGEVVLRYPHGSDGRDADIQAGAGRGAVELVADVRDSADRLDRLFGAVADASGWDLMTEHDRPAHSWLSARWREIEIHRADLRGAYGATGWPATFIGYLLPRLAGEVGSRAGQPLRIEVTHEGSTTTDLGGSTWTPNGADAADGVTVRGPDWALLAWLTGRPTLADGQLSTMPELSPWR